MRIFGLKRNHLDVGILSAALICEEFDSVWFVLLYADESLVDLGSLHEESHADEYLVGLLKHETVVGSEVRLTLHSVDDDPLGLELWWRHELDVRREACSAHTYDASLLDDVYDGFGGELRLVLECDKRVSAVNGRFPLVAFNSDVDSRFLITARVNNSVYLEHCTADR